jgi:hypothetical protein
MAKEFLSPIARTEKIVIHLSSLIYSTAQSLASEQYEPSRTPDISDDFLVTQTKRLAALRKMREDLENLMTGVIL